MSLSNQILNARTRVFYEGGTDWVSGWIYDVQLPKILIASFLPLPKDGSLSVSAQGDLTTITFNARVVGVDIEEVRRRRVPILVGGGVSLIQPFQCCYELVLTSGMRHAPSKQVSRKAFHQLAATIVTDSREVPVLIEDISAVGAGLFMRSELSIGRSVHLICELEGRPLTFPAKVMHCRQVPAEDVLFSAGLRFDQIGRVEAALWKNKFNSASSTPSRVQTLFDPSGGDQASLIVYADTYEESGEVRLQERFDELMRTIRTEHRILGDKIASGDFDGHEFLKLLGGFEKRIDDLARDVSNWISNLD